MSLSTQNIFKFLPFLLAALVSSCAKTTIDEIPSYVSIDSISISPNTMHGTASQKITDAWVYADNILVGAFQLPAQFPVLKSGKTKFDIYAGIKLNGINETRSFYPFYKPLSTTIDLHRDSVVNLGNLQFSYADNTTFTWQEDFEQVNLSIESTSKSEVNFVRTQMTAEFDTVFPYESNNYAAKVVIPNDTVLFECASHDSFVLPTDGHYVFMELNYKSNNPFTMGLLINGSVTSQRSVLVVNPSKTWNKIYINLTPSISANNGASSFKIFLAAMKSTSDATAEIYFDNIKLLHD